jgi:GPI mannosyltransferase 2
VPSLTHDAAAQALGIPLITSEPVVGALLAHFYHFCSVGFLWLLISLVTGDGLRAFVAALLHIFSPAGLFLSAPYSEASFSALSFAGLCLLVWSFETTSTGLKNALVLLSGSIFERALRHRSNGIFNGIPILAAFLQAGVAFLKTPRWVHIREVLVFGIAGVWLSLGLLDPQVEAFFEYCSPRRNAVPRPWCSARIPSIYSFVQDHYW